jgi:hypothetical protein
MTAAHTPIARVLRLVLIAVLSGGCLFGGASTKQPECADAAEAADLGLDCFWGGQEGEDVAETDDPDTDIGVDSDSDIAETDADTDVAVDTDDTDADTDDSDVVIDTDDSDVVIDTDVDDTDLDTDVWDTGIWDTDTDVWLDTYGPGDTADSAGFDTFMLDTGADSAPDTDTVPFDTASVDSGSVGRDPPAPDTDAQP